ncbi:MAG: Na+:solute symporter [Saprospiraceae bacterium]|nr:Na+:solute symporter [Saprospiraceae bacterium]
MSKVDYYIILLFSLLVVAVGLSFSRSGKNMKSFFAAGGAVPWGISSLSLFMSFFSAGTFVVWGSIAYQFGMVSVSIQWMMCIGGILVGLFIAGPWRKTGVLTAAEFVRERLGEKAQQFYTYLILFLSLAYAGAFLYPVAKLVNVSTGFSITACVILLGVLIMIYTAVGGLWAVMITDVLQFVILTAAVIIVVPLALRHVGGWEGFTSKVPEDFFQLIAGEYSPLFLGAFLVYNMIFIGGNWAYVQRYTSVNTVADAKKVGLLFGGLYTISPLLWMLPPMLFRAVQGDLSGLENEGAYLLMCKEVLPAGMLGLMLGGMIFATASSVNTTLNLSAAVFTNDLYKVWNPKASNTKLMWVARVSTLSFGVGTIIVALLVPAAGGIVEVVLSVGAVTGCSLYGPPIWAIFSKRQTGKSILAITLISLAINLFFKFGSPYVFGISLSRAEEMLLGSILPFLLLGAYEIWALQRNFISPDYQVYMANLAVRQQEAVVVKQTTASNQNQFGLKVLSIALVTVGLMIIGLGINATDAQALVIGMGTLVAFTPIIINRKIRFRNT